MVVATNRVFANGTGQLNVPEWKLLAVSKIKDAPHNPKQRTLPSRIKKLVQSMGQIGLIYPILVDAHNNLIDGHRRVAAARELGWESIPAIVLEGDNNATYATVNETSRHMSGAEMLAVWAVQPEAVPCRQAKEYEEMREVIGHNGVRRMVEGGLSGRTYYIAKRLARYCGEETNEFIVRCLKWLMSTALVGVVRKALETGVPAAKLRKAIEENRPLTIS